MEQAVQDLLGLGPEGHYRPSCPLALSSFLRHRAFPAQLIPEPWRQAAFLAFYGKEASLTLFKMYRIGGGGEGRKRKKMGIEGTKWISS